MIKHRNPLTLWMAKCCTAVGFAVALMSSPANGAECPADMTTVCPSKANPFLLQLSAEGSGPDLASAKLAAKASLKKRASRLREKFGFPIMQEMFLALTHHSQLLPEEPEKPTTTVTLGAWFHLDFEENLMTPLPIRCVPHTGTSVLQEHDVVHCSGY